MTEQRTVRCRIFGRVQGVGYRNWTVREARRRGLSGWVRNRTDGSVEAAFGGPAEAVATMLDACRTGPRHAVVSTIETADVAAADSLPRPFGRWPTA
jgi:acylphosphatase